MQQKMAGHTPFAKSEALHKQKPNKIFIIAQQCMQKYPSPKLTYDGLCLL